MPLAPPQTAAATGPNRRRVLTAGAAALLANAPGAGQALTDDPWGAAARLSADFEPLAAMWLGYDAGHEALTAELAAQLQPFVPLKLLVRDAGAEVAARALLGRRGVAVDRVQFVREPQGLFFVRDAAVFAHDASGRPSIVDFRWSHYGWAAWCRQRHAGRPTEAARCAAVDDPAPDDLDRHLADGQGLQRFASPLAMEGGGVEVNGQGLLIANQALWVSRNPGLSRAAIETELLRLPGIRKVIWLPTGLAQDPLHRATIVGRHVAWGTGGHTDEFVRFADARTVLLAWPEAAEAARHPVTRLNVQRMQHNFEILSRSTDLRGRRLRVLKLPLPRIIERKVWLSGGADTRFSAEWSAASFPVAERRRDGDWVMQVASASTLNFVVANGVVLLPDYRAHGTPLALHGQVQRVMAQAFDGRQFRFVDAVGANWVGGGAHCATLSEPAPA
ncbi:MAG: agmatine deiminase family protein [Rubrivivax sp.]|nr:agmatine deiminase family protein [Rubrivivax sp.]